MTGLLRNLTRPWPALAALATAAGTLTSPLHAQDTYYDGTGTVEIRVWQHTVHGSGLDDHVTAEASVGPDYVLVGGGARVNWQGVGGQLLTGSYPINDQSWSGHAKAHHHAFPAHVTPYAIGVTTGAIPGFGSLDVSRHSPAVVTAAGDAAGIVFSHMRAGYALTCLGGTTIHEPTGRLLHGLWPSLDAGRSYAVASRTHLGAQSGPTTAWALEARRQP